MYTTTYYYYVFMVIIEIFLLKFKNKNKKKDIFHILVSYIKMKTKKIKNLFTQKILLFIYGEGVALLQEVEGDLFKFIPQSRCFLIEPVGTWK